MQNTRRIKHQYIYNLNDKAEDQTPREFQINYRVKLK
jgi:hypothetical protein